MRREKNATRAAACLGLGALCGFVLGLHTGSGLCKAQQQHPPVRSPSSPSPLPSPPLAASLRSLWPEKLKSHHRDDRFRPVNFRTPPDTLPATLPDAASHAAYVVKLQKWASGAREGEYPEAMTTGGAVVSSSCPQAPHLFGGSGDSKSPTGWVVCMGHLGPRLVAGKGLHRRYPGPCRKDICPPVPAAPLDPPLTLAASAPRVEGRKCIAYSFGVGEEDSFEQHLAHDTRCEVHAFDPVPTVASWVRSREEAVAFMRSHPNAAPRDLHPLFMRILEAQGIKTTSWKTPLNHGYYLSMARDNTVNPVRFHPWGLAGTEASETIRNSWSAGRAEKFVFKTLKAVMKELGHTRIDVLKLDIEGFEWEVLQQVLDPSLGIDQLMLEMHFGGGEQWLEALAALHAAGFKLHHSERLRYHGRGCAKSLTDPKCRGGLQELSFVRSWR